MFNYLDNQLNILDDFSPTSKLISAVLFAMTAAASAAPARYPDPRTDPLVFIANPVEANMPGHWVPLSIVKVILEQKPTFPPPKTTRKPAPAPKTTREPEPAPTPTEANPPPPTRQPTTPEPEHTEAPIDDDNDEDPNAEEEENNPEDKPNIHADDSQYPQSPEGQGEPEKQPEQDDQPDPEQNTTPVEIVEDPIVEQSTKRQPKRPQNRDTAHNMPT